jgi:hypothetical protein
MKKILKKSQKFQSQRQSQEGKRLQIQAGYFDWYALQKVKKL